MFERFTEKAIKVIMLAQEEARRMGHNFVGTEQILLGLCGEGTGIAARVLRAHNIKLKDLRVTVLAIIGKGSGNVSVQIPFTPRAKKLLETGWNIARDMEHTCIGTEHLLLGLLEVDGAVAKQVLGKHNVDLEKIRIDVLDFVQPANKQQQTGGTNPAYPPPPVQSQALARSAKGPLQKSKISDLFSESAVVAMQRAQDEYRWARSQKLELQHLLVGIFAEGSSQAAKLLVANKIEFKALRLATTDENERNISDLAPTEFHLSNQVFAAVEMASVAAKRSGKGIIYPEHLLLALLSYDESRAVKGLQKLGVNTELLMEDLRKVICVLGERGEGPALDVRKEVLQSVVQSIPRLDVERSQADNKAQVRQELTLSAMVEHSFVLAEEEAHRLGHVEVDSDHLLLGLITETDGLASLALHTWDVKTKELRQESANMPGREKAESPCESRCGSKVNELILVARKNALQEKRSYVGTDHVLLAILADENSAGFKVLRNLSIDIDRLKKTLQNANIPPLMATKYSALVPLAKQKGFERFSDDAIKSLMFAREEASRLGHAVIDSQFLLLGICDERLNKGAERLRKIGISLHDLRFDVERLTGHGQGASSSEIVFSNLSLQVMQHAFNAVVSSGLEVIRPEHLFVNIIVEENGPAYTLLRQFTVSIDRLRASTALKLQKKGLELTPVAETDQLRSLFDLGSESIYELLSHPSLVVLRRCFEDAQSLSQKLIEPSDILLGLLSWRSGIAVKAAAITGISISRMRGSVQRMKSSFGSLTEAVAFSESTRAALTSARVMAELCKSSTIEPDHLLCGILKHDSCIQLFANLNYNYQDYQNTVMLLLKANEPGLFPANEVSPDTPEQPPFLNLTDKDRDKLFGGVGDSPEKHAMKIFSVTAQSAIMLAIAEGRRLGRTDVGTDLLLLGVLSGEDSVSATVLQAIGITSGSIRGAIEKEYGVVSGHIKADLPFSKNTIIAFEKAFEMSRRFGLKTIGPDQLLIGIISQQKVLDRGSFSREDCAGVTILRSLSVDIGYLRQLIFDRMSAPRMEDTVGTRPGIETGSREEDQVLPQSKRFTYSDAAIRRFDNFAADSLKAILIAHEEAREKRLSLVGTEQILLALILEPEGKAGVILQSLGVTAQRVRAEIERFVQSGSRVSHGGEPYTSDAIGVFHLARSGAHFIEGKVGTEHLLLGIVTNPRYFASIILQRAGVDVAKLQEIMAEEQVAISALGEAAAQTNQTIEKLRESLPIVDYQAALALPDDRLSDPHPGIAPEHIRESVHGALQGMISDQSLGLPKGDWIALKERFTANLRTVIDGAKADSCNRNNGIVDAPQLLFALLNLPTNSCAYHLTTLNIDRFALRNRLDRLLQGTRPRSSSAFVGFSALADKLLLRAFQLSIFEGGGWVQTKHLLLALIESNDEKFFPFLVALQLRSEEVVGGSTLMPPMLAEPTRASRLLVDGLSQASFKVTATAERAMKFAASEARQMGHNFVGTEQVMLGLISAGDGVAGQVLLTYGLSLTDVRRRVRAIIGLGSGNVADEVPFTPRTQRMLDLALCEAQRLQHDEIGTGHILLGLLREGHGVAARVLTEMGLSLDKLIEVTEGKLLEDAAKKSSSIGINNDATSDQAYEL